MGTRTEQLDNLYTTTWQNMKGQTADNIFDATPFWFWLRANGGIETAPGGRFLTEPLRFAKSDNIKWIRKGGTTPLVDKEFMTVAVYNWTYLTDTIVRFGVDDQQNRGKNQIINLMKSKLENSQDSLVDEMETRLLGTAGTDQMNGLQDIVPEDPTASAAALGGIDPSVDTWWRSKYKDLTGVSFASLGLKWMANMLNDCGNNRGMDKPNIILCGQAAYEMYDDNVLDQKRIQNKTMGDAGFESIQYKGIPMVWTPAESTGQSMYFLNTRFLKFVYDAQMFFDMTEWKSIPDQVNDRVAQVITAGNLVTGRRRVHGVTFNVDTV